jgi:hypothetical protein
VALVVLRDAAAKRLAMLDGHGDPRSWPRATVGLPVGGLEGLDLDARTGAELCLAAELHDQGTLPLGQRHPQARPRHGAVAHVGLAEREPGCLARQERHQRPTWPAGVGGRRHGLSLGAEQPNLGDARDRAGPGRDVAELDGVPDRAGGASVPSTDPSSAEGSQRPVGWPPDGPVVDGVVAGAGVVPGAGLAAVGRSAVERAVQPVTATVAAKIKAAMILAGRTATSPLMLRGPAGSQGFSLRRAGHVLATPKRRGKRETASTRSRSSIETSTPPGATRFRTGAVKVGCHRAR